MRKILSSLFFISLTSFAVCGEPCDAKQFVLKNFKIKTLLEFGMGDNTLPFLENSNKVISVEFATNGYGPLGIKRCLQLYRDYSNWIPIVFFTGYFGDVNFAPYKYLASEHVHKAASYQCATHQNYALIDDFYLTELNAFTTNLFKCHKIDAALVNPGIFLHGDLVQLLFGRVPLIMAVSTHCRAAHVNDDVYGYSRVVTPEDYEEIFIPEGITLWLSKDEKYVKFRDALKAYVETCFE